MFFGSVILAQPYLQLAAILVFSGSLAWAFVFFDMYLLLGGLAEALGVVGVSCIARNSKQTCTNCLMVQCHLFLHVPGQVLHMPGQGAEMHPTLCVALAFCGTQHRQSTSCAWSGM
jgi:hypothetical protein